MSEEPRVPFVPLRMAAESTPHQGTGSSEPNPPEIRVVYVRYRDPTPLEFPDRPERLPGPVFHVAGILLREDDEFLALGEVAWSGENEVLASQYGRDLFPAYRNILTIPKATIQERRDFLVPSGGEPQPPA